MAWVYLIAAIRPVPSVSVLFFYLVSISLLVLTLKRIDIGVSYAVWTGVGTSLIAAIGILWFQEPATTLKVASLVLIIAGVLSRPQPRRRRPGRAARRMGRGSDRRTDPASHRGLTRPQRWITPDTPRQRT
ncbi:MAG: multidrug efflux SMR transporter [Rubrobacter sp.]|nr:multidrug efflux SMR transporter [Rubrobacter sp.]